MNKKEFLQALENKLSVLDKEEKQDIIAEYTDTINEKIKQGQTEEEAVKDFGDIDDLAKEILKAYKINPDYEDKTDSFAKKSEELIKQGASTISDFSRKLAKNFNITSKDISLELIFEIIIRIFIVLLAALILKGVFSIFGGIGESLFDNLYDPLGTIFVILWKLVLMVIYILLCALIVIAVFKKYFKITEKQEKEIKEEKAETKLEENKKELKTETTKKQTKKPKGTTLGDVCLLIVKIFVIIYVIVPFIFLDSFIILGLIVSIIYLIKGINLIGLVLLLAGMAGLFTYIIKLIISLLFSKGKASVIPVIINIILMIIGGIMFVDMAMNIDYIDKAPSTVEIATETQTFNTNKKAFIHYNNYYYHNIKKVENKEMPDGQFIIEIKYNKNRQEFKFEEQPNYVMEDCQYNYEDTYYDYEDEYEEYQKCTQATYYYLNIYDTKDSGTFGQFKENYNQIIKDLKQNKIYNYSKMYDSELTITANQKTLDMIKTN